MVLRAPFAKAQTPTARIYCLLERRRGITPDHFPSPGPLDADKVALVGARSVDAAEAHSSSRPVRLERSVDAGRAHAWDRMGRGPAEGLCTEADLHQTDVVLTRDLFHLPSTSDCCGEEGCGSLAHWCPASKPGSGCSREWSGSPCFLGLMVQVGWPSPSRAVVVASVWED